MSAWTKLIENSSLSSGTAWDHLNNQVGGGGGGPTFMIFNDGLEARVDEVKIEAALDDKETIVSVDESSQIVIELDDDIIEVLEEE